MFVALKTTYREKVISQAKTFRSCHSAKISYLTYGQLKGNEYKLILFYNNIQLG